MVICKKPYLSGIKMGLIFILFIYFIILLTACTQKEDNDDTMQKASPTDKASDMTNGKETDNIADNEALDDTQSPEKDVSDEMEGTIVINEVCSKNNVGITASNGGHYDWVELYNTTNEAINIKGFKLMDDDANPEDYDFPDVTIEAEGFLLVFVDDDALQGEDELIANFGISQNGDILILKSPEDEIIDTVEVPAILEDTTYGRQPDGSDNLINMKPTPNKSNDTGN